MRDERDTQRGTGREKPREKADTEGKAERAVRVLFKTQWGEKIRSVGLQGHQKGVFGGGGNRTGHLQSSLQYSVHLCGSLTLTVFQMHCSRRQTEMQNTTDVNLSVSVTPQLVWRDSSKQKRADG